MTKYFSYHIVQQLIHISTIVLFCLINQSSYACKFEGLIASCHKDIDGIPLQISARINNCHSPVDISFLIKSPRHYRLGDRNEPLYWEYTFVTTNHEESKEIPGFGEQIFFCLHAEEKMARNNSSRRSIIELEAYFRKNDGKNESLDLISENVTIYHPNLCLYAREEGDDHITRLAVGMSLMVILLFICAVSSCVSWHRNKRRMQHEDTHSLVRNMVPQSQTRFKSKKIRRSASSATNNIKYVVPKDKSKDESHELQIYVSTTTGLEKVDFPSSHGNKAESSSNAVQQENEDKLS